MKDFWQKVKSFFKKFWHFVVIGVLSAAIITMIIVMCVCMVPKGKGNGGNKNGQLEAPQNLSVSIDRVLIWDEVDHATSYTVKINDDETTTVTKNSLDLTLDTVKAKLVKNAENTLSVKANATKNYKESAYSEAITYEYVITPSEEAAEYAGLVGLIGTITVDNTYAEAQAVLEAITIAEEAYNGMTQEAKLLDKATEAKASFDAKKEGRETALKAANDAYSAFVKDSLTPAIEELTKAEDYDALAEKAGAAKTAYEALSKLAQTILTENEENAEAKESYESLATTVEAWKEEIDEATTAWDITFDKGNATDDDAEDYIAAATELTEKYDSYPAYVQAKITNYTTVTEALEDAQAQIKTTVKGLQDKIVEISGKIENNQIDTKNLEEHYKALAAIQEKELGAYATKLWNEAKDEDEEALDLTKMLEDGIEALLEIPFVEDSAMRIFVFGATGKINIVYSATNVKGEPIEKAPELEVKITASASSPENPAFTKLSNGVYFCECEFTQLDASANNYTLAVGYSINGVEKQALTKYKAHMDTYFENGYTAIVDGKIAYNGAPAAEAYFDIYVDGDIDFSMSNNDALPTMKNLPLLSKVPVKNAMTLDEFRAQLAKDHPELIGKEYDVRFVVYKDGEETVDGDSMIHLSCVKSDRISHDTYHLDLTKDDTKVRVNLTKPGMGIADSGSLDMSAAAGGIVDTQFAELGIPDTDKTEFEWIINVSCTTADDEEKSGTFTVDYTGWTIGSTEMMTNLFNTLGAVGNVEITFELRIAPKEDSKWNATLRVSNPVTLTKTLNVSLPDDTIQVRFNGDQTFFEFLRTEGGNGKVFNFGVKAVEVKVEKDGVSHSVYLIKEYDKPQDNSFALTLCEDIELDEETGHWKATGESKGAGTVGNGYITLAEFNSLMNSIDGITGFDVADGWEVSTRVLYLNGGNGGYSETIIHNA